MSDISTDVQVWFLRHGKTLFDYENSKYDDFIEMLCNGQREPLAEDHDIHFDLLPQQVDFIGYSPATRAFETAKVVSDRLDAKSMKELEFLREVKFDKSIIRQQEYKSLSESRGPILERWYYDENEAEKFEDSLARVRKIESFLSKRQEKTIILITHGWFLRILEIHFVQGKRTEDITLQDILNVKPVALGHSLKATVVRKNSLKSQIESVGVVF